MSNLNLWRRAASPFSEMDNLLEDFWRTDSPVFSGNSNMRRAMAARVEVSETPTAYLLKFDVPGLKKEDIKIDLHENRLTVSGERKEEKREEKDHKVHYSELSYGSFLRSYSFPTAVDSERVEAAYDGGVLTVQVAKMGGRGARQISVK